MGTVLPCSDASAVRQREERTMKEIIINKTGKTHIRDRKACEDAYFAESHNGVYVLADGVSSVEYGGVGAKTLCNTLGETLCCSEWKRMLADRPVQEVRENVCHVIDHVLSNLSNKYGTGKDAFASTLLAFVRTGSTACLLHAGDGCIFGLPATGLNVKASVLSYPDNDDAGGVYQAGHPEQKQRMRVIRINLSDFSQILLATDGFSNAYLMEEFQGLDCKALEAVFKVESSDEMEALIQRRHIEERRIGDDISCVLLKNETCNAEVPNPTASKEKEERDILHSSIAPGSPSEAASWVPFTESVQDLSPADVPSKKEQPVSRLSITSSAKTEKEQQAASVSHSADISKKRTATSKTVITALFFATAILFAIFTSSRLSQLEQQMNDQKHELSGAVSQLQSLIDCQQTETVTSLTESTTAVLPETTGAAYETEEYPSAETTEPAATTDAAAVSLPVSAEEETTVNNIPANRMHETTNANERLVG